MSESLAQFRHLVVKNGYGQLGNRLYRLGNLIGFAIEHGLEVYDFAFADRGYASFFQNTKDLPYVKYPKVEDEVFETREIQLGKLSSDAGLLFNDESELELDYEELEEMDKGSIFFEGFHFQADELTKKYQSEISRFLVPSLDTIEKVNASFASLRNQTDLIVGVHIRQGDFKQWQGGGNYFEPSEFATRMRELSKSLEGKRHCFICFSDGSLDNAVFSGLPIFISNGAIIEDLYSLSRCDYIMGAPHSTFSGWSSYYGKVPIYPLKRDDQPLTLDSFKVNEYLNNSE